VSDVVLCGGFFTVPLAIGLGLGLGLTLVGFVFSFRLPRPPAEEKSINISI